MELRDLEADRRFLDGCSEFKGGAPSLWKIADAALDEIKRLKGLLVRYKPGIVCDNDRKPLPWLVCWTIEEEYEGRVEKWFPTEAAAWAAVRKAACK
jgi:hypothetical protein